MSKSCFKCGAGFVCAFVLVEVAFFAFLKLSFDIIDDGELFLPNAPGIAVIVREQENGIAHVRGDSHQSLVYAQGFAHAQT